MEDRDGRQVRTVLRPAASLPALLLVLALGQALTVEASVNRCAEFSREARTGDLIFRAENSWLSRAVMHAQQDWRFSHVGIVVETSQGARVFHAEFNPSFGTDGVVSHDLCTFARRALRLELRRLDSIGERQRQRIAEAVHVIGAPRFNLRFEAWPADGSVYCTQYVWRVLKQVVPAALGEAEDPGLITVTKLLDMPGYRLVATSVPQPGNQADNRPRGQAELSLVRP
jgi:hypothetical protein